VGDRFAEERFWALNALAVLGARRGPGRRPESAPAAVLPGFAVQPAPWLAIFRQARPGKPVYFLPPTATAGPAVLLALEITCRLIERPMIAPGARIARRKSAGSVAAG